MKQRRAAASKTHRAAVGSRSKSSLRIIAGTERGRKLAVPPEGVRPTLDRVREALFNILAGRIEGASFLDLYAGSGAHGLEALSRGAARSAFADVSPEALATIRANALSLDLASRTRVLRAHLPGELHRIPEALRPFDIIVADPPYEADAARELCRGILANGLLAPGACFVLEHPSKRPVADDLPAGIALEQSRSYGHAALSIFYCV